MVHLNKWGDVVFFYPVKAGQKNTTPHFIKKIQLYLKRSDMVTVAGVKPAANLMISFDLIQFWLKFSANSQVMLQSRTAARRKPAARRQVNQIRHRARDHIQAVCNLSQDRDRCNQALGIG